MATPTTITGRYYKRRKGCKELLQRPLICKFCFSNKPTTDSGAIKHLGNPGTPISFGPFHSEDPNPEWQAIKHQSWKHVLRSSKDADTTHLYVEAIKRVETEARALYENDDSLNRLSQENFLSMMINDGCLMLQAAICALGGWKLLGYPPEDTIFGEQRDREKIKLIVGTMFVMGNQIPLIILMELMKQSFFQRVLHSGKWKRPIDLPRRALFDFLIVPAMTGRNMDEPSDFLHGFWLLLAGPRCSTHDAGEEDDGNGSSSDDEDDNELHVVPNATKLQLSGISFKDNGGRGTRGIRFNKTWFSASVSLPSIVIDSSMEILLRNLMRYEFAQQMGPNCREACSYLQLMCELVRTPDDAKVLADHGIICCHPTLEEELPKIFNRLSLPDVKCNHNVRRVRNQIRSYRRFTSHHVMWEMVPMVAVAILLLVVVVLQILTLIMKCHQKPGPGTSSVSDVGVPLRVVKDGLVH